MELLIAEKKLIASLPFTIDPIIHLKPNRFIAEKVFRTQLDLFSKRPDMKEDTVRSHDKLLQRGYVKKQADLSAAERAAWNSVPGDGYFIPWWIVHNEGSLSTQCRMVFDASSKTPGGDSLNCVLAKDANRLVKMQTLLARFRQNPAAMSADINTSQRSWMLGE